MLELSVLAIAVIVLLAGAYFVFVRPREDEIDPVDRAIAEMNEVTARHRVLDVFHINEPRLMRIYEQMLATAPSASIEHTTVTTKSGELKAEFEGIGGSRAGESTTTVKQTLPVIEARPGVVISTVEDFLVRSGRVQLVDLTDIDKPLELFLQQMADQAASIGLQIPVSVEDDLKAAWRNQERGLAEARLELKGYVRITANVDILRAAIESQDLVFRASTPAVNGSTPSLICEITASGRILEGAGPRLRPGAGPVGLTTMGSITGRTADGIVTVSAIYSYWI